MKIKLNRNEAAAYTVMIKKILSLPKGQYYFRTFAAPLPSSPRLARKLFEETAAGNIACLRLVGSKSANGYIKI